MGDEGVGGGSPRATVLGGGGREPVGAGAGASAAASEFAVFGFYPKMRNTFGWKRSSRDGGAEGGGEAASEADSVLAGCTRLSVSKKYSGFLGLVFAYRVGGRTLVAATSKNATGTWHAQRLEERLKATQAAWAPTGLVRALVDRGMCVGFEVMHPEDVHGTVARRTEAVVTMVAQARIRFRASDSDSADADTDEAFTWDAWEEVDAAASSRMATQLVSELEAADHGDLAAVLGERSQTTLRLVFYTSRHGPHRLVMLKGTSDAALEKLGAGPLRFPRGGCIVWVPRGAGVTSDVPPAQARAGHQLTPKSVAADGAAAGPLLAYLAPEAQLAFARAHGLAVDSRVTVSGREATARFWAALSDLRDDLTDARFEALLTSFADGGGHVVEDPGTVRHADVLGDVLEGLIVTNDDTGRRFKFKTVRYICRTIILRAFILARGVDKLVSPEFGTHFVPLVHQWTRPSNHALWRSVLWGCALKMRGRLAGPDEEGSAFCARGGHLEVVDEVLAEHEAAGMVPLDRYARVMDTFAFHHAVVLVVGPVGSGKSTWAGRIVRAFPDRKLVHVDGDCLVGDADGAATRCLGAERNPLTWSLVLEAWIRGQIPVLSCGGGQLCDAGSKGARAQLYRRYQGWFGASCNLAVCTAIVGWDEDDSGGGGRGGGDREGLERPPRRLAAATSILYGDAVCESLIASQREDTQGRVEDVVRRRLRVGEWRVEKRGQTEDVFVASIVRQSRDNHVFTEAIVQDSLAAIRLAAVTPETHADVVAAEDFPEPFTSAMVHAARAAVIPATVRQVRSLIPWFGTTKHVTLSFGERQVTAAEADALRLELPNSPVRFRLVSLESPEEGRDSHGDRRIQSKKQKRATPQALVVDPAAEGVGSLRGAHVTIQSGPHLPRAMKALAAAILRDERTVSLPIEDPTTFEILRQVIYAIPDLAACPTYDLAPLPVISMI